MVVWFVHVIEHYRLLSGFVEMQFRVYIFCRKCHVYILTVFYLVHCYDCAAVGSTVIDAQSRSTFPGLPMPQVTPLCSCSKEM